SLIIVSVLSLISLNAPGAESTPDLVISPASVGRLGGYVGGGVAWTLLMSVGRWVGVAILVGTIIAGVVVCGFSISGAVSKMRGRASIAAENYREVREERREMRAQRASERKAQRRAEREASLMALQQRPAPAPVSDTQRVEPKTTFLGARKTSVLTRTRGDDLVSEVDAASQRLVRRRHPNLDVETALPAGDVLDRQDALFGAYEEEDLPWAPPSLDSFEEELSVPDFLKNGKKNRAESRPDAEEAPAQGAAAKAKPKPKSAKAASTKQKKPQPAPKATTRPGEQEQDGSYELPPFSMLSSNPNSASSASSQDELDETMARLQSTLAEFGLTSRVVDYTSGPLVTTFQVEMGEGERVNKITNLQDDIALSLAAKSVRIFAPIPGTSRVGIEIPNKARQNVHLGDVLPYASGGPLEFAIGRDAEGRAVTADLAAMPHLLVAGATGSGKSVMINSLIMSLLMRDTPKQVRLILVDPKRVEFSGYNGLPHLYVPVVTEPRQAASALQLAVSEMERRLKVFERAGARNINVYNEMCTKGKLSEMDNPPEPMPFMVIIIDELADLMMVAGKDVEASIVRIAQLARAAGIHLVLATQRPSANVVTG
ncbi:MAG: DNA translocase FtsK, partial [Atopobiaceae bacterium]|nr:DNA translocase FtsK [Atopobiaceae bacterium]